MKRTAIRYADVLLPELMRAWFEEVAKPAAQRSTPT